MNSLETLKQIDTQYKYKVINNNCLPRLSAFFLSMETSEKKKERTKRQPKKRETESETKKHTALQIIRG